MISLEKACEGRGVKTALFAICLSYFFIQLVYIFHLPLMHDEFQQAYSSFEVFQRTPYLDYKPYKTVLGYYTQAVILKIGLAFFQGSNWQALIFLKASIALFNALMLYIIGALTARVFVYGAVLLAITCFIFFSNILEHGTAIRVDMMTGWFGFLGLALVINRYYIRAGLVTGLSFLFSQKGIYYNASLIFSVAVMLSIHEGISRKTVLLVAKLIFACVAPASIYCFYWLAAGAHTDSAGSTTSGALAAYTRAKFYFLEPFWQQMLERNIGGVLLAVAGLGVLIRDRLSNSISQINNLLLMYALFMTLMVLMDKNTWPYFFVLYIPLLIFLIPVLCEDVSRSNNKVLVVFIMICMALVFYQWIQRINIITSKSNHYQHKMVDFMQELLKSDGTTVNQYTYIAGFRVLLEAKHAESKYLGWLDKQGYIRLLTVDPEPILASLEKNPPVIILRSKKTHFPDRIEDYFSQHYQRLCGSIETYTLRQENNAAFLSVPINGFYSVFSGSVTGDKGATNNEVRYYHAGDRIYGTDISLQYAGSIRTITDSRDCNEQSFLDDNYEF